MKVAVVAFLILGVFAGCLSNGNAPGGAAGPSYVPCEHPYPCGDEWPDGLEGPFDVTGPTPVEVPSHDGVVLRGWLFTPTLPEGMGAPTIITSTPYIGLKTNPPSPQEGGFGELDRYAKAGYAILVMSVRGTGVSDGCFENKGEAEQADQAFLVEWAAVQPWSSGRIAMAGTSYPGTTPFMAANLNPPHLITILPNGPVTDPYTELHTPQGAAYTMGGAYEAGRRALVTFSQENAQSGEGLPNAIATTLERLCPEVLQVLLGAERGHFTDDRNGAFWRERQLIYGFPNITAAVFLSHGLQETAHPFQEDIAWEALRQAPKRMLFGQWDHEYPRVDDWQSQLLAWLDFWLKGIGKPADVGVGIVTYQDTSGDWHNSTAWPPVEAKLQAITFAANGTLSGHARDPSAEFSFRSLPPAPRDATGAPKQALCASPTPPTARVFRSDVPLTEPALVAGNPFAHFQMAADQAGGLLALHLYRLPAGTPCDAAELVTFGTADLRFYAGTMMGKPFPVNQKTVVRIDLNNVAAAFEPGDSFALVASYGDTLSGDEVADPITDARFSRTGQPYFPVITIFAAEFGTGSEQTWSTLVLPVIGAGIMGGQVMLKQLPPRPFTPA